MIPFFKRKSKNFLFFFMFFVYIIDKANDSYTIEFLYN